MPTPTEGIGPLMAAPDIYAALPCLSRGELEELRKRVDVLLGLSDSASGQMEEEEALVATALWRALGLAGYQAGGYFRPRSAGARALHLKAPIYLAFCNQLNPIGQAQRLKGLILCFNLVLAYMTEVGLPITPTTLLNQAELLPTIFERGFPGYARSGLLSLVLQRRIPEKGRGGPGRFAARSSHTLNQSGA